MFACAGGLGRIHAVKARQGYLNDKAGNPGIGNWFRRYFAKRTARRIAKATPSNAKLIQWANETRNQPPQSWFDDETDPFEPGAE